MLLRQLHRYLWRRYTILLLLAILVTPAAILVLVQISSRDRLYTNPEHVPTREVAIIFGAGLRRDGSPTRMLADRVRAGAELYRAGRAQKLLMTGDNSSHDYNEVAAMQRYAEELGVPSRDITLDYAGFSTYESCYRARAIFGVERAVLITQQFHLPRAVYTCRELDIDAIGLGTPDWGSYHPLTVTWYTVREQLATLNAAWQLYITRPQPTFLGPFEGLS